MKTLFSTLICMLLVIFSFAQDQYSVLYGERKSADDSLSVYFDKEGTLYPRYYIPDASLLKANASLKLWYKANPEDFKKIAADYKCGFQDFSEDNFRVLNDSVTAFIKHELEMKQFAFSSVSFLIHGFRKPYLAINGDIPSTKDYNTLQESIQGDNKPTSLYVRVYWDGLYCEPISWRNILHINRSFEVFDRARSTNAPQVGKGLRKLVTGLPFEKLNMITHSLGAEVACSALFDIAINPDVTPSNKQVNLCLIAPAIAGSSRFAAYYSRNSSIDFGRGDNYRLMVLYNENDFVLKKKKHIRFIGNVGPGPDAYGNTRLGCNFEGEATKLENYFKTNYPKSAIRLVNLQAAGVCHLLSCYAGGTNLKALSDFIEN